MYNIVRNAFDHQKIFLAFLRNLRHALGKACRSHELVMAQASREQENNLFLFPVKLEFELKNFYFRALRVISPRELAS